MTDIWAWYAGYLKGRLPAANIAFDVVTHVSHFSVFPNGTGGLNRQPGMANADLAEMVNAVHAAGRKVVIAVGGAGSYNAFKASISPAWRTTFVNTLVSFMLTHGYDGIDVDMEPINGDDVPDYVAFIAELRAALNDRGAYILAVASPENGGAETAVAQVQADFDVINVMTYDMASDGYYNGLTWHNSALHSTHSFGWRDINSVDKYLAGFMAKGIPAARLGFGLDFYGYAFNGATAPLQAGTWTPQTFRANIAYFDLAAGRDLAALAQWDEAAGAAWFTEGGDFYTFDNERTVAAKVAYLRERGLARIAIWELCGGTMPNGSQPLVDALRVSLAGDVAPPAEPTPEPEPEPVPEPEPTPTYIEQRIAALEARADDAEVERDALVAVLGQATDAIVELRTRMESHAHGAPLAA